MVVFPALAVMTAVLSFNLLGDAWRDWLDPAHTPNSKSPTPPADSIVPTRHSERSEESLFVIPTNPLSFRTQ